MNPFVSEYRSLPPSSDHLPDTGPNYRKCRIQIAACDEDEMLQGWAERYIDLRKDP